MVIAIAEDMKKLTEDIIASHDVRVKTLRNLAADTNGTLADARKTIGTFTADRKKMAVEQAKELAGFAGSLSKDVQGMLKEAQKMVKEFHKNNKQMSREQAEKLLDFVNNLTSEVGSMLDDFHKGRRDMAKELHNRLWMEIKDIQKQVGSILDDADKFVGECRSQMAQARKSWKDMDDVLTRLEKGRSATPTTVKQAMSHNLGKKKVSKKSKSRK
jgi:light-regulated signal transduction histidine kinase (bacteriophytochrome)